MSLEPFTLTLLEEHLYLVTQPTGLARYDFAFEDFFPTRHPIHLDHRIRAIARMGAPADYDHRYAAFAAINIDLIHTPAQYALTSYLPNWYPLLEDLTPRSLWFDRPPTVADVAHHFSFPIFLKGARQTSRHQRRLSIIESPDDFDRAVEQWSADPILAWQPIVCREFIPLRPVGPQSPHTLPRAYEFRSFWYHGHCVGIGPYWQDESYDLAPADRADALAIAAEAARRLDVPFAVIDIAQSAAENWLVIECNDVQDAGYAGINPMLLWRRILDLESNDTGSESGQTI